jgi:hypothetical protein
LLPRFPLDEEVLLSFDVGTPVKLVAWGVDVSPRCMRVQLPTPLPDDVVRVRVGSRSTPPRKTWGTATVDHVSSDCREVVLFFRKTPRVVAMMMQHRREAERFAARQPRDRQPRLQEPEPAVDALARFRPLWRGR